MPDKKQTALAGGLPMPVDKSLDNREVRPAGSTQNTNPDPAQFQPNQYQNVSTGLMSDAPKMNWEPEEFKPISYQGTQGRTEFSYDPRKESMVAHHMDKLLDPKSALMRRAAAQSQGFMAQRGLQSSSIANGNAMATMIDKALPIASQDASTYGTADQTGWQHGFTAEQNNLDRSHQASMLNAQAQIQQQMQNQQMAFQAELNQLQHLQSLGMLDAQGAQRMQELNAQQQFQFDQNTLDRDHRTDLQSREAQLTQDRDKMLQGFQERNLDQAFLRDLEMKQVDFQRQDEMFEKQLNAASAEQYRNASASAYNNYLAQLSLVMSNPEMTPEQQTHAANRLRTEFNAMRKDLQLVYGFSGSGSSDGDASGGGPGIDPNGPGGRGDGGLMAGGTPTLQPGTPTPINPEWRAPYGGPAVMPRDRHTLNER